MYFEPSKQNYALKTVWDIFTQEKWRLPFGILSMQLYILKKMQKKKNDNVRNMVQDEPIMFETSKNFFYL